MTKIKDVSEALIKAEQHIGGTIRWGGASYQSAKSAAVADVRTPDGKTHRLYVRRTMPKARTFHGLIDGTVVGIWGGFEMAKAGLADLFERGTYARPKVAVERRSEDRRRANDRVRNALIEQAATKLEELQALVKRVQDALATGETGDGLVEVARNAARAEREHALCERKFELIEALIPVESEEDEAFRTLQRRVAAARGEEPS